MRTLVLGGAGFLGKRVVHRLRAQGHDVFSFDRPQLHEAGYMQGDMTRFEDLWEAFRVSKPEVVVHLAYILGPETKANPYMASRINVAGTLNVFEACRLENVKRVVYASSIAVYGPQSDFGEHAVSEADRTAPIGPWAIANPYGSMKMYNEASAIHFADAYGMEMVGIRFAVLFGHGRSTGTQGPWASAIVSRPAVGQPVELAVSPNLRQVWLYVDDAAEFVVRLTLLEEAPHRVYVTGGTVVTVSEFADAVRAEIPDADIRFVGEPPDQGDAVPVYRIDNKLIVATTGHKPASLQERIRDHAAEARAAVS